MRIIQVRNKPKSIIPKIILCVGIPMLLIGLLIGLGCFMRKYFCPWIAECDFEGDDMEIKAENEKSGEDKDCELDDSFGMTL